MKKLTRDEMKNVMGGFNLPADEKSCVTDADCGSKNVTCGGTTESTPGHCHNSTCTWNRVC